MSASIPRLTVVVTVVLMLGALPAAQATPLFGLTAGSLSTPTLYDVDPATGAATNPRSTGLDRAVGIAFSGDGTLYGLTNAAASNPNALYTIDAVTGAGQFVGITGLSNIIEGDLAFDPIGDLLYGLYELDGASRRLFTLDRGTGTAVPLPGTLPGDPSAMAFAPDGTLYVIDTTLQTLMTVDKTTGLSTGSVALNVTLGSAAGMTVDPDSGTFYVADGESDGTDKLYTLDVVTGQLTEIGSTGVSEGLAGLAYLPEPSALPVFGVGAVVMLTGGRRRIFGAWR